MTTILLILVLLLITLFAYIDTKRAVFLSPLLFPLYLIKATILGVPFQLLELGVYGLLLGLVIRLIVSHDLRDEVWGQCTSWVKYLRKHYAVVIALISIAISAIVSFFIVPATVTFNTGIPADLWQNFDTRRVALGILKGWFFAGFVYTVLVALFVRTRDDVDTLLNSYIVSAILLAAYSLCLFLWGSGAAYDARLIGPFTNPNYISMYVGPAVVIAFYRLLQALTKKIDVELSVIPDSTYSDVIRDPERKTKDWIATSTRNDRIRTSTIWLIAFLFLGLTLFLTKSYASWIAVIATIVLMLFLMVASKKKVFIGALVLLVVFAGLLFTQRATDKFKKFTDLTNPTSTSKRLEVYQVSLGLMEKSPWLGIGLGQYEVQYKVNAHEILGHTPMEWVQLHPHNLYLSWVLNLGILGLFGFLLISLLTLLWGFSVKAFPAVFSFLTMLIHGLVDTPFWKPDLIFIFLLLVVCVICIHKEGKNDKRLN